MVTSVFPPYIAVFNRIRQTRAEKAAEKEEKIARYLEKKHKKIKAKFDRKRKRIAGKHNHIGNKTTTKRLKNV